MVEIDWDMVKKLYETGSTDHSIGKKFECSFKKIYNWRHKNRLPANYIGRHKKTVVSDIFGAMFIGITVTVLVGVFYNAIKKYIKK
jgi:hypothetical protein